jgi:hypothetical protein
MHKYASCMARDAAQSSAKSDSAYASPSCLRYIRTERACRRL